MKKDSMAAVMSLKDRKKSFWVRYIAQIDLQLMVIPALVLIFIFSYLPMYGVLMSFQDYDIFGGFFHSPWVGFKHFKMFFDSPDFWNVMRNTIVISFLRLLIGFPAPIILAIILNEVAHVRFKKVIQTISYLPHFLSWVIVSGLAMSILATENGSLNILLEKFNLINEPINFLSIPNYFWGILISTGVWKEIGFSAIIYIAAIAGINPEVYEAASIDGATRLKKIMYITIPGITGVIIIFMILAVGDILSAGFEDILLLAKNPVLQDVSDVIDTYVYRVGIKNSRFSYAAAVGLFKSIISIALLTIANAVARKIGRSLW
ncbi:protein lplB [Paenibacillus macquariensis subsp. defensor]|nr:protein lplB [Paenibacillus macquariensis subsp. defensor]